MRNKVFKLLLAIVCLLSSTSVSAYDFEVDGIYYNVVSLSDFTCKVVTRGDNKYKGDIVVPATVNYANRTLTVVSIGTAFQNCSSLTSVTIPNSVAEIGNDAFYNCRSLTSVTIPNSVTTIGKSAFYNCSSLASVTIPNSVTTIGRSVFASCSSLTSVTIPNSVTTIGNSAFYNCSSLTSVTIPNSVTTIGDYAFQYCSSLTSVTIPNSVTTIRPYTFNKCSSLTEVYSLNPTPPSIESNNFTTNQYMTLNVYVPQEALNTYQNTEPWKNFWGLQGFDTDTGIGNIKLGGEKENGVYYDLSGRRLNTPRRGLNIVNGKKVWMR